MVQILRAQELGIRFVIQSASDKLLAYRRLLADAGADPSCVCCIGDDLPDLPAIRQAGLGVAVADGCSEVREAADYVTKLPGGQGAVRETIFLSQAPIGLGWAYSFRIDMSDTRQDPSGQPANIAV